MKWTLLLALFISNVNAEIIINDTRNELSIAQEIKALKIIKSISNYSPLNIKMSELIVDLTKSDTEAFYAPSNYIFLPIQLRAYMNYFELQSEELTKAVWVHELAHLIFNINLAHDLKSFDKVFEYYRKRDEYISILDQLDYDSEEHQRISIPFRQNNQSLSIAEEKLGPLVPYDELFAEIFTVLYFDDFQIMEKALTFKEMHSEQRAAAEQRDFTDNFTHSIKQDHTFLSPSKKSFWVNARKCRQDQYQNIIKQTYIIFKNITKDILKGIILGQEDANRLLIKKFNQLECNKTKDDDYLHRRNKSKS